LDEEENGEDIPLVIKSKKHGYKWAPQFVFLIFKEELLHWYNKRTQQVVGVGRPPSSNKSRKKMGSRGRF
jgi:hypothetical protein